ncbi:hypothetical protein [Mesorhizobium sp. B2-3-2]|uniref:hypothetical protein n=1 Tax=Mesorhizobium sp. B2-3-2 TaxID=2589961 RepID=UPI0032B122FB
MVRSLAQNGGLHPDVGIYVLGTVQEEIGSRGAQTAAFNIAPQTTLAVDIGVAMDYPRARPEARQARSRQRPGNFPRCQYESCCSRDLNVSR